MKQWNRKNIINFNAGPAALPDEVLLQAREETLSWNGSGMSVMEQSHRSDEFRALIEKVCNDLRSLLSIPESHRIVAMQGGARQQFAMIPMNFLNQDTTRSDYLVSGFWSELAAKEAEIQNSVVSHSLVDRQSSKQFLAEVRPEMIPEDSAYVHMTTNETIDGIEFHHSPQVGEVPLVADMSSDICTRPWDVSQYSLVYACAQKTLGIAGVTFVIIRDDFLEKARRDLPTMFRYDQHVAQQSVLNTSPTHAIYMSGLVLQWMIRQGGLKHFELLNKRKAERLYRFIDESEHYDNSVHSSCRSLMNVPFTLKQKEKTSSFLDKAFGAGFRGIKGHRVRGGVRVSLYNPVTLECVDKLLEFMHDFTKN